MNVAVSKAKLSAPRLNKVYPRIRLFEQLDSARQKPLTWLSAPAGAGKTSLVASWLDEREYSAHWYQVDEGDADLATFFYHLGQLDLEAGCPLPLLTPEYLAGLSIFTRNFFRQLFSRIKPSGILVLDNFQDAGKAEALHEVLQLGCSEIPVGVNIIIISREDPPPVFARFRANNALALLGWEQLRLNAQESHSIVQFYTRHGMGDSKVEILQTQIDQIDGWVAGLVLLVGQTSTSVIPKTAQPRTQPQAVFDYFTTEVFQRLDQASQCLLTRTALLPRVTPAAAQALSKLDDAATLLEAVYRRNFFTMQHPGPVYEYHPLFRAFLRQRLRQTLSVDELAALHQQSAQWLLDEHQPSDAIELFIEGGIWEVAVPLVLQQAQGLLGQGRGATLVRWLDKLPDALMEDSPWLLYWRGVGELATNPAAAQVYLERAYGRFKVEGELIGSVLSWSAVIDSFVFEWRCLKGLDHWIDEAQELTNTKLGRLPQDIRDHFTCGLFIALMFRQPRHPDMTLWANRTRKIVVHGDDPWLRAKVAPFVVMHYTTVNRKQAAIVLDALRSVMNGPGGSPMLSIAWAAMEGLYQTVGGDVCEAAERLTAGLSAGGSTGIRTWEMLLLSQAAIASLLRGDSADHYLRQMRPLLSDERYLDRSSYHYLMAWQALAVDDVEIALAQAQLSEECQIKSGTLQIETYFQVLLAQCLFAHGNRAQAVALIDTCSTHWQLQGHAFYLTGMARAWFEHRQGDESACLATLRRTLNTIVDVGDYTSSLLPQQQAVLFALALTHDIETVYVQRMIRKLHLAPAEPQKAPENWPFPIRVYTLGRFSLLINDQSQIAGKRAQAKPLELLKLIIALGGREIADARLEAMLWPDAEGDAAHRALITNLQRLRKLLNLAGAIDYTDGRLSLSPRHCWVDVWAFERAVAQTGQQERAQEIYKGDFLAKDSDQPWLLSARERLHRKFIRNLSDLGAQYNASSNWDKAIDLYQRGLDIDDTAEVFYQGLMQAYVRQGRRAEMEKTYQQCRRILSARFGTGPSLQTSALYRQLRET